MPATTWQDLLEPGNASDFFERPPGSFRPDSAAYDDANAWWLMELSRLVYRPTDRARFLDRANLEELEFSDDNNTEAYIVRSRDQKWAALVFRGSDDLRAWLTNLQFQHESWSTGEVHAGFKRALVTKVWPDVLHVLDSLDCPLFYAGHSLGGALAVLAASLRAPRATYTFGSPLVGNAPFAATFDGKPLFRVVNHIDVVTSVPPAFFGYHHAGELHRIGQEPSLIFRFDQLTLLKELAELFSVADHPPEPLADHAPINYAKLLGGNASEKGARSTHPSGLSRPGPPNVA